MENKKEERKYDRKDFWSRFWRLLKPSRKEMKFLLVLILVLESTKLISPYIFKLIIDRLTNFSTEDVKIIIGLVGLMFLSGQLDAFVGWLKNRKILAMIFNVEYYLPISIQEKLVYLSLQFHEKENTGNKITKAEKGVGKIIDLLINLAWDVVPTIFQLALTFIVLLIVDWRFGATFFVFSPVFIYITYKVNRDISPIRKSRYKNYEVASGLMAQSIININTVKSFVQEEREVSTYQKIRRKIKEASRAEWFKLMNSVLLRELIVSLGRASILMLAIYLAWTESATIGTVIFVVTLSEKSYSSLWRLFRSYDKVEEGAEAVDRLMNLMSAKQSVKNPKNGIKPKSITGEIKFKDLCFSYKKDSNDALRKTSFKIDAGCTTALVGPSGGGKTTVARLIYRHYDPQSGSVELDGRDLREYDSYAFRKFISIVPQEVEIFNDTVMSNIAYAKPDASYKEVVAAAKIANAHEFIEKLSKKYKTEVGERGIRLSGGQRQRVGIARAILANPRILIFDEATSSLDSYSEKLIQDAMQKVSRGRTVIIIAHRLSTVQRADKIIVLEEGRVVEKGSHLELAKMDGGLYARLLELQRLGNIV